MEMTARHLRDYLARFSAQPWETVVLGHTAPDTDAVVSAVFTAWEHTVTDNSLAVPVIRSDRLPREVTALFGEFSAFLPLLSPAETEEKIRKSNSKVILTDHHDENPFLLSRTVEIIDHHLPEPGVSFPGTVTDIRRVGASTSLVALSWQSRGLIPDDTVARLLLGAILTDTEGLSPSKTYEEDKKAVAFLTSCTALDLSALFHRLREELLRETDLETLYRRDYRTYGTWGFAVLKVKTDLPVSPSALQKLARQDRQENGFYFTLAKVTAYGQQGIEREWYLFSALPEWEKKVAEELINIGARLREDGRWEVQEGATYISRKRLAPRLNALLK